ncbi:unnamed protein product [Nezara viridula]|uniref:Uncharacterized protein n=1 Tax=Nezara viridula TaxID=85310 RepID=A0A9P0HTC0_NEZVI|nr:unnamed protein product [Nezara viridula]
MEIMVFDKERLLSELKLDKKARETIQEDNRKLDIEIRKLEKELNRLQKEDLLTKAPPVDNPTYKKYLEQIKFKESQRRQLAVDRERLRIMIEARTDITELNVELLTQAELIRIVKQLERRKVDTASKLQQAENSLDTTAKEVIKLKDALKMYQTEIELRDRKRGVSRLHSQKF